MTFSVREAIDVNASDSIRQCHMTGLREQRGFPEETPRREKRVNAARVGVVTEDSRNPHHGATSRSNLSCFPGSYRRRTREEANTMRSICGSLRVAHTANPYSPANTSRPARNE